MKEFRIGKHISTYGDGGFTNIPFFADSIGCRCFQIFLDSPLISISKARLSDDLKKFSSALQELDLVMVVHGSYTINFCNKSQCKKYGNSVRSLVADLNSSIIIGKRCLGVIIHMGKNVKDNLIGEDEAIKNYINGLKEVLSVTPAESTIILETGAGQGTEIGTKLDQLEEIYKGLDLKQRERIGFCIDTCHIFASGYDIRTKKGVRDFFSEFENRMGKKKISCIHFNDSKTELGSRIDRHADLLWGKIGEEGLREVAILACENFIPLILETPLESVNKKTNLDITFEDELALVRLWVKNCKNYSI